MFWKTDTSKVNPISLVRIIILEIESSLLSQQVRRFFGKQTEKVSRNYRDLINLNNQPVFFPKPFMKYHKYSHLLGWNQLLATCRWTYRWTPVMLPHYHAKVSIVGGAIASFSLHATYMLACWLTAPVQLGPLIYMWWHTLFPPPSPLPRKTLLSHTLREVLLWRTLSVLSLPVIHSKIPIDQTLQFCGGSSVTHQVKEPICLFVLGNVLFARFTPKSGKY